MSVKRQATTELNHENWDQDDPEEHEEMGSFKVAPKDILEKRVIRTAKRRTQLAGDETPKNMFKFGGFNKPPPASFDFLSKLTNGNNDNNTASTKAESSVTSSLFTSTPLATSPSSGLFGIPSTATPSKSPFSSPSTQASTGTFGMPSAKTSTSPSIFMASKADSTVSNSPFKIQTVTSSTDSNTDSTKLFTPTVTSSTFDIPSTSTNVAQSLFSSLSNTTTLKTQPASSTTLKNSFGLTSTPKSTNPILTEKKTDQSKNEKKMKYYSKLKGLNESVSDWIKKHVEQTPLCILTPIFKDYEKYLKEIQDEYEGPNKDVNVKKSGDKVDLSSEKSNCGSSNKTAAASIGSSMFNASPNTKSLFATQSSATASTTGKPATFSFGISSSTSTSSPLAASSAIAHKPATFSFGIASSNSTSSTVTTTSASTQKPASFSFGIASSNSTSSTVTTTSASTQKPASFSFGIASSTSTSSAVTTTSASTQKPGSFSFGIGSSTSTSSTLTTSSAGFSFGAITSSTASAVSSTSPFSFATTTTTTTANGPAAPFSFGIGKPFSFNSNVKQNTEPTDQANEDEDTPPKVEFTPVVEENSVFDKRCKIFVKKDGNFVDKGVGTLYIKKIEDSAKHQLLVRANTNLGTILVNLILVSAIPTKRMGKSNVMLVCIPTPDSKPPPTPILIRVKTSEEADELLETLDKYKT